MRPRLVISFSGGRTSALMTKMCVDQYKDTHDIEVIFANTGWEHEKTLEFVDKCDRHWGWNVLWMEARIHDCKGLGPQPDYVTYKTASRNGEPFRQFVEKEGLPDANHGGCTDRLKRAIIVNHVHQVLGWKRGTYKMAIGIRADEVDRINSKWKQLCLIYPLITAGITKEMVKSELETWPFDLELPSEAYGNCVGCWKKSPRKLLTLAKEHPQAFDFALSIEEQHATTNCEPVWPEGYEDPAEQDKLSLRDYGKMRKAAHAAAHKRRMYRGYQRAADILEEAKNLPEDFRPYRDEDYTRERVADSIDMKLDGHYDCDESCEVW